jgi:hypothetical protein
VEADADIGGTGGACDEAPQCSLGLFTCWFTAELHTDSAECRRGRRAAAGGAGLPCGVFRDPLGLGYDGEAWP